MDKKQDKRKPKLGKERSKALVPMMKQFNKMAKSMIALLTKQIDYKEKKLSTISVLIQDLKIPESKSTISIQALDMNKTKYNKKGFGSENKLMEWERKYREQDKGIML